MSAGSTEEICNAMGTRLLWVVIFVLLCTRLAAQIKPAIEGIYTKEHFIMTVEENANVMDSLNLSLKSGKLHFYFVTYFDYGHSCGMEGDAEKVGDHYEYKETLDNGTKCVLQIIPSGFEEITLRDTGSGCRGYYCGVRGHIEGAVFYRVLKKEK